MATIKIRGRLEPITVTDDVAKKVKDRKFGNGNVPKAEPNELLDLGDWSGEYGRIVEIELSKKPDTDDSAAKRKEEEKAQDEAWYALSLEEKASKLGFFKFMMSGRTGDFRWEPTPDMEKKIVARQLEWFKANPRTFNPPTTFYGDLLPPKKNRPTLGQMKRITHNEDEIAYPS